MAWPWGRVHAAMLALSTRGHVAGERQGRKVQCMVSLGATGMVVGFTDDDEILPGTCSVMKLHLATNLASYSCYIAVNKKLECPGTGPRAHGAWRRQKVRWLNVNPPRKTKTAGGLVWRASHAKLCKRFARMRKSPNTIAASCPDVTPANTAPHSTDG